MIPHNFAFPIKFFKRAIEDALLIAAEEGIRLQYDQSLTQVHPLQILRWEKKSISDVKEISTLVTI